jgi:hypothetical protein
LIASQKAFRILLGLFGLQPRVIIETPADLAALRSPYRLGSGVLFFLIGHELKKINREFVALIWALPSARAFRSARHFAAIPNAVPNFFQLLTFNF